MGGPRKTLKRGSGSRSKTKKVAATRPKAISLFSGAGGDSIGMEAAGYKVVAFSEIDPDAAASHLANLPASEWITNEKGDADITTIPDAVFAKWTGQVDLIFAGFPCTGFSIAGKRDDADPRNELFEEFVRVVGIVKPRHIIGENVGRLLNVSDTEGETQLIDLIAERFKEIGYALTWSIVKASNAGVPQVRKRLLIVGMRGKKAPAVEWDKLFPPETNTPVRSVLRRHLRGAVAVSNTLARALEKEAGHDNFWIAATAKSVPQGEPHNLLVNLVREGRLRVGHRDKSEGEGGEVLDPSQPSKVVTTAYFWQPRFFVGLRDTAGHHWVRALDEAELAAIQGFPPGWKFVGSDRKRIRQIGNAVPPPIVCKIATLLRRM